MFGYSPDYAQGQMDQQVRDNLARRQDDNLAGQWQRFANELEARLARANDELNQAIAETKAARVQRDVLANRLIETQAVLRQVSPNHRLCDEVKMIAENRAEVDRALAQSGISIDRSGTSPVVVRTR